MTNLPYLKPFLPHALPMTTALSAADLREIDINSWEDCADDFINADLLLGNGFSMSLSNVFAYGSLFERFLRVCEPQYVPVLRGFGTTNFELILEDLGITSRVNGMLGLPQAPPRNLADVVREGLIRTIEQSHPRKAMVPWNRLERIAAALDDFGDIFTLNYDALLYHIIMIAKDRYVPQKTHRYNDYFWNRLSDDHLRFMEYQGIPDYKHAYYLHGALFLFKTVSEEEVTEVDVKLRTATNSELLDAIAREIRAGNIPLFVSEGTSEDKQRVITRSDYLHFANSHLKARREAMVIYGASLGHQDDHIAAAVDRSTERAAVAIYVGTRTKSELRKAMYEISAQLSSVRLVFFDSTTLFV